MVLLLLFFHPQVYEVLKLLNELLPTSARDLDAQQVSDKEAFLVNCPSLLQKFGMDILPLLIQVGFWIFLFNWFLFFFHGFVIFSATLGQVVNSGANLYVCYGCLSVVNKLVYLSKSDMLLELLKNANISRWTRFLVFLLENLNYILTQAQIYLSNWQLFGWSIH